MSTARDPRYFILLSDCLLYTAYSGNLASEQPSLKLSYKIPLTSLRVKASSRSDDFQVTNKNFKINLMKLPLSSFLWTIITKNWSKRKKFSW